MAEPLVQIKGVRKDFPVRSGILQRTVGWVQAVAGVDLDIHGARWSGWWASRGAARAPWDGCWCVCSSRPPAPSPSTGPTSPIWPGPMLEPFRRTAQMIFQDPFSSLDPRAPVGKSIAEGLRIHGIGDADERHARVCEMLELVGLSPQHASRFPHEFSGGQRQRIGIARALVLKPAFVVADEPVSALDVSVQAQVLNLLKELQGELHLTLLFVAHNLAVVEHISDRVAVMYLGQIVELTDRETLYRQPLHPYTEALLAAIPVPDPDRPRSRHLIEGEIPSPLNPPSGCRFHTRCPIAVEGVCDVEEPMLRARHPGGGHLASCHLRTGEYRHLDRATAAGTGS